MPVIMLDLAVFQSRLVTLVTGLESWWGLGVEGIPEALPDI